MRKILMFALTLFIISSAGAAVAEELRSLSLTEALKTGAASKRTITPTVDGKKIKVDWYVAPYLAKPNRPEDQLINIYVPENATKESPVLFLVNNAGWQADAYALTIDDTTGNAIKDGVNYRTVLSEKADNKTGREQRNAYALKRGFVIVSYGCRSRNNGATGDLYLGHSPATMVDTKAAIRYLRANRENLGAGNTDRIIVTGRSGGGALTAVIAASGNSPDYFEGLFEVGAAGIKQNEDGSYVSDPEIGDNVFAAVAYCPITDLGHADGAYEFTYSTTREKLFSDGNLDYSSAGVTNEQIMANSKALKTDYIKYVDSLKLKKKDGSLLSGENLEAAIQELLRAELDDAIAEFGVDRMRKDLAECKWQNDWLKLNDDGSYEYDYTSHLYFVAMNTKLKIAPAFSNMGLDYKGERNEDNLFGFKNDPYSPFNFLSWNNDVIKNEVGKDDTGLDWDIYLKTDAGKKLAAEIKMTSPMEYLASETNGESAPYWYVRYGMRDRDSSFAVETVFYHGMINDESIKDVNFEFAWLEPHSGDYDVPEAFAWLDKVMSF